MLICNRKHLSYNTYSMSKHTPEIHKHETMTAVAAGTTRPKGRFLTFLLGNPGPSWATVGMVTTKAQEQRAAQEAQATITALQQASEGRRHAQIREQMEASGLDPTDTILFQEHLEADRQQREAYLSMLNNLPVQQDPYIKKL
jgi:hypothetical protein